MNALQSVELSILQECIRICEKHEIRYFLIAGSALGAVRHAGFIPWDDDIDVGMPRPDYEKFLRVAQSELRDYLFVQTFKTDPGYPQSFAKIRNSNTTFVESVVATLDMNHGIYIDIFPLDGYPAESWIQRRILRTVFKICKSLIIRKFRIRTKRRFETIIIFAAKFVPVKVLRRTWEKIANGRKYYESDVVASWFGAWGLKEVMPREVFGEGRQAEFEGLLVQIPSDYDAYLKSLYGNYLEPPPIDKRITGHAADVIDVDKPYTVYVKGKWKSRR